MGPTETATMTLPLTALQSEATAAALLLSSIASGGTIAADTAAWQSRILRQRVESERQQRVEAMLSAPAEAAPAAGGFGCFHNRLRIMLSLDRHDLVAAGVMLANELEAWTVFRGDPFRWYLRAADDRARALETLIRKREGGQ